MGVQDVGSRGSTIADPKEVATHGAAGRPVPTVAVIGAGIAGLTAAHELAVRGFAVTVFEAGGPQAIGGKARSFPAVIPDDLFVEDVPLGPEVPSPTRDVAVDRAEPVAAPVGGGPPGGVVGSVTLPAEHGFRFFPGFYRHVIDSMRRTPAPRHLTASGPGSRSAADHLVGLDRATIARAATADRKACSVSIPLPRDGARPGGWAIARMVVQGCRVPRLRARDWPRFTWDALSFSASLVRVITSSETRYWGELEERSWSEYISAHRMLDESEKLFGNGLTRTFVATQAETMSARTGATILLQLLYDICLPERLPDEDRWASADRVLDGPTSDVWLQPWRDYLANASVGGARSEPRRPVTFETDRRVCGLRVDGDAVVGLEVECRREAGEGADGDGVAGEEADGPWVDVEAVDGSFDEVVLAVPAETVQELLVRNPPVARQATRLRGVFNLDTEWMNGVLFYLRDPIDWFPDGHVICLDSAWALTVVDQSKAWDPVVFHELVAQHGFRALLSVDVSNWEAPGDEHHIPARFRQPPGASVRAEVWRQLRDHFPDLPEATPTGVVDPGVTHGAGPLAATGADDPGWVGRQDGPDDHVRATRDELRASNAEPLMVNTVGSWTHRPDVEVGLANLVVAGDFVRSSTDFASMEAANESARRAVDLICSRRTDRPDPAYRTDTAIPDLDGLVEPQAPWFAGPRDLARHFDRWVAYPLGWRAPLRAPLVAWLGLGALTAARGTGRRVLGRVRRGR